MQTLTIKLQPGPEKAKPVRVESIMVPDLWHIAQNQLDPHWKAAILDCWHLTHELLNAIRELPEAKND